MPTGIIELTVTRCIDGKKVDQPVSINAKMVLVFYPYGAETRIHLGHRATLSVKESYKEVSEAVISALP